MKKYIHYAILVSFLFVSCSATTGTTSSDSGDGSSGTSNSESSVGISLSQSVDFFTTESGGSTTFTLVLDEAPTDNVIISLASSDTTEATVSPSSLTFTSDNWDTAQEITVTGVDDDLVDGNVSYTIEIDAAVSDDSNYDGADLADVVALNIDDDEEGITVFAGSSMLTAESGAYSEFTVVLNSEPAASVEICLDSSDTTEGTLTIAGAVTAGTGNCADNDAELNFTTANWSTAQTVRITGADDSLEDGNVTYNITIDNVYSTDVDYADIDPDDVALINVDDDVVGITVYKGSSMVTAESGTYSEFTVVLNAEPEASVEICMDSSDTTEGTLTIAGDVSAGGGNCAGSDAELNFTTSNWSTPQTVRVTGVDDSVEDGNVDYTITMGNVYSSDADYAAIELDDVSFANVDDETAGITVLAGATMATSELGNYSEFTVVLNSEPTSSVEICMDSSDASEGILTIAGDVSAGSGNCVASEAEINFTTGNWSTPQTVRVEGVDDSFDDGDVAYSIAIDNVYATDGNYSVINPDDVSLTNINDDTADITVLAGDSMLTTESGGTSSFTIMLDSQPTNSVDVCLNSSDDTEGLILIGGDVVAAGASCAGKDAKLTFTTGNWSTPQTVVVEGQDDVAADGDIAYTIEIGNAVSTDDDYNALNPDDVSFINEDDD